jgi:hypothetical protein
VDIGDGGNGSIEDVKADGEFDVTEAEQGTERVRRGQSSIFPGMIEVEKCDVRHVHDSVLKGRRGEDC